MKTYGACGEGVVEFGVERARVIHGMDGMDEITTTTATKVLRFGTMRLLIMK